MPTVSMLKATMVSSDNSVSECRRLITESDDVLSRQQFFLRTLWNKDKIFDALQVHCARLRLKTFTLEDLMDEIQFQDDRLITNVPFLRTPVVSLPFELING